MVMAAESRKTALETMVCETSGYLAILAAALNVSSVDRSGPNQGWFKVCGDT
jgi:hypothetical protein